MKKSGPIRILVVDGNMEARCATSRALQRVGYEVIEASTGAAALQAAPRADLVVLEVDLPDFDGFEICARLRARPVTAQIPVLHLSATFTDSQDFAQGLEAGADSYLRRPVESPALIATVRTLLFARRGDLRREGLDARLHVMFDLAPIAIALLDGKLCVESVNPAYCELTGYRAEELIGKPFETGVDGAGFGEDDVLQSAGLMRFKRKDGQVRELEWHIAQDTATGFRMLFATDVSARAEAESARESLLQSERAARGEVERSNRLKEELLATLSHELRNPLNAILGWATILNRRNDLAEPVMQGLQAIERNSRIQARMITDLLDYAGISFGKVRLVFETIDPYPVVRAAIQAAVEAAAQAGITVQPSFGETGLRIEADAGRLQQIVWNLLTNAIKFSTRGASVVVTAVRERDSFRLVVSDSGKGIEPDFLPRIFERVSRRDATMTRSHGGLGLGMAIVKQLTDLHGGTIRVASGGKGQGTTVTLDIPLGRNEAAPLRHVNA